MAKRDKPNILIIWGDDIKGMIFADSYGEQSCKVGVPAAPVGLQAEDHDRRCAREDVGARGRRAAVRHTLTRISHGEHVENAADPPARR